MSERSRDARRGAAAGSPAHPGLSGVEAAPPQRATRGAQLAALAVATADSRRPSASAVYAHAYFARLHDALRDDFGALARRSAPTAFHDLVLLYLMAHPPARPSLRHAGARLAGLLARSRAEFFRARWPFAADLAPLEWAIADVFDARTRRVLVREELAAVAPEAGRPALRLVPRCACSTFAWPVQPCASVRPGGRRGAHLGRGPSARGGADLGSVSGDATSRTRYRAIARLGDRRARRRAVIASRSPRSATALPRLWARRTRLRRPLRCSEARGSRMGLLARRL